MFRGMSWINVGATSRVTFCKSASEKHSHHHIYASITVDTERKFIDFPDEKGALVLHIPLERIMHFFGPANSTSANFSCAKALEKTSMTTSPPIIQ